jgi:hypothetical protein
MEQNISAQAPKKKLNIIKWALIVGIAIVVNLFIFYLVDAIYKEPVYTDFCPERQVNKLIESEAACLEIGGQWNENINRGQDVTIPEYPYPKQAAGYCNPDFTCNKQFEDVMKVYNRNVFVVFVIAGILLLAGSVYLGGAEAVSLGLAFGGVIALIIGSVRYWSDMNDILRVIVLGVALVALVYVAWKKFQD